MLPPMPGGEEVMGTNDKAKQDASAGGFELEQWHEVVSGDTLSKIARQYYGDPSLYTKIFEANRDVLKNPDLIKVGQKLRIP